MAPPSPTSPISPAAPAAAGPRAPTTDPIVIFGVPRSGTTLLRTLLDAHPNIAAGPEAPWLAEHQPRSVLGLARYLMEDEHGMVANFGASRQEVLGAARRLVDDLLGGYARRRGKRRWAHKTPNDILHIEALLELLPDARIIWLVRDGLDVAMSTAVTAEHRRGVSPLYEKQLKLADGMPLPSTPLAALLRWGLWNHRVSRALAGAWHLRIAYEDLARQPEDTAGAICTFIGEPFDPAMLRYDTSRHDLPKWEWGSADVRHHTGITPGQVGRAQRELSEADRAALQLVAAPVFLEGVQPPVAADEAAAGALVEMFAPLGKWLGIGEPASREDIARALEAGPGTIARFGRPSAAALVAACRGARVEGTLSDPLRKALAVARAL